MIHQYHHYPHKRVTATKRTTNYDLPCMGKFHQTIERLIAPNRSCRYTVEDAEFLPVGNVPYQFSINIRHTKAALKRGLVKDIKRAIHSTNFWSVAMSQTEKNKSSSTLFCVIDPNIKTEIETHISEYRQKFIINRLVTWKAPSNDMDSFKKGRFYTDDWDWVCINNYERYLKASLYETLLTFNVVEETQQHLSVLQTYYLNGLQRGQINLQPLARLVSVITVITQQIEESQQLANHSRNGQMNYWENFNR